MRLRGFSGARDEFHLAAIVQTPRRSPASFASRLPMRRRRALCEQEFIKRRDGGQTDPPNREDIKSPTETRTLLIGHFINGIGH
jgi:hypothetical protein